MLHNTFLASSEVFTQVPGDSQTVASVIHKHLPKTVRRLIKTKKSLYIPAAFILPKKKKNFIKGRPVIRFHKSPYQTMYRAAARILLNITEDVYKNGSFAHFTVSQAMRRIRRFKGKIQKTTNQDLVGFFTSVPQDRIKACVKDTIAQYCRKHNCNLSTPFRAEGGKKYAASTRTNLKQFQTQCHLNLRQVLDIVSHTLEYPYFRVGEMIFKQTRGVMIGNPLAPILCALAIIPPESQWFDLQQEAYPCVPIRYVDNLLALSTDTMFQGFPRDYYHFPIELEDCEPENKFLGFKFWPRGQRIHIDYDVNMEQWSYVSWHGAGSLDRRLSGLLTRSHLAFKHCYPAYFKVKALKELSERYIIAGFHRSDIRSKMEKFNTSFHL
jgi:hypothetical protein